MAQYLQHSGDSWVRWLHHDKTCLQMEQLRTIMKASIKEQGARWVWKSHHRPKQKAAAPGSYLRNVLSNKTIQDTILSQYFLWLFCPFLHQQWRPALTHVDIDSTTGMRRPIQSPHLSYKIALYHLLDQIVAVLLPGELHLLFSYRYRLSMGGLDSNFCWYFHRKNLKPDRVWISAFPGALANSKRSDTFVANLFWCLISVGARYNNFENMKPKC